MVILNYLQWWISVKTFCLLWCIHVHLIFSSWCETLHAVEMHSRISVRLCCLCNTKEYYLKIQYTRILKAKPIYFKYLSKNFLLRASLSRGPGGCVAQWKHSCFSPSSLGFQSQLCLDFFSLLLSLSTVLRSNPSSAKQWISQIAVSGDVQS